MARRGDRVRCTVMFEGMREGSGKVPVFFALNGKKIVIRGGDIFMDYDDSEPLFPHIGMTDGSSVLAKVTTIIEIVLVLQVNFRSGKWKGILQEQLICHDHRSFPLHLDQCCLPHNYPASGEPFDLPRKAVFSRKIGGSLLAGHCITYTPSM